MKRDSVIERLISLPGEIENAELQVIDAVNEVQAAKEELTSREGELLLGGAIDGKNAESRNAQLRQATAIERQTLAENEQNLAGLRTHLNKLQNEFKALRSISQLLSTEVA